MYILVFLLVCLFIGSPSSFYILRVIFFKLENNKHFFKITNNKIQSGLKKIGVKVVNFLNNCIYF